MPVEVLVTFCSPHTPCGVSGMERIPPNANTTKAYDSYVLLIISGH